MEHTLALSTIAVVASSPAMMYFLGARIFNSRAMGAVAAVLFVATPVLWTQIQSSPASLYPLPAVIGWLLAVSYIDGPRASRWCIIAGLALGFGVYTSLAAAVMMPVYLVLTVATLAHARSVTLRQVGLIVTAFVLAAAPFALTLLFQPDDFRNIVNTLRLYDANRFNVLQGIREMISWVGLTARSEVYYNYFSPAFLFLQGGVLLPLLLVLLPIGFYRLLNDTTAIAYLVLVGLLAAPVAAALTADPPIPRRVVFLTPFAAVVSSYGVQFLWSWVRRLTHASGTSRRAGTL